MSAIIGLLATAFVARVAVPAGAKLIDKAIQGARSGSRERLRGPVTLSGGNLVGRIPKIGKIDMDLRTLTHHIAKAGDTQTARRNIVSDLLAGSFYLDDETTLKKKIKTFERAATKDSLKEATSALFGEVRAQHKRVFRNSIRIACNRASLKLGFSTVEMLSGRDDEMIRMATTDGEGRTLVTEISTGANGNAKVDTEVLGVNGNGCQKLVEDFYKALIDEGVRVDVPPIRKGTGGICTLSSARMFLKKRPKSGLDKRAAVPVAPAVPKKKTPARNGRTKAAALKQTA